MDFKIISDVEEAKRTWEILSPSINIDDEWNFRYAFFKHLPYDLFFIVGCENNEPRELIALQKNNLEGLMPPYYPGDGKPFLEFFGGDDTDDNKVLGYREFDHVFGFLKQQNTPAYLAPLDSTYQQTEGSQFYENKFYLDLKNYKSHEDFLLDRWSSDSRKKIRQQINKIYREHNIEILINNYEDIDLIAKYNLERFGKESSFSFGYRKEIFKDLTQLYDALTLTILIDGKKEAVSFGIIYNQTYIGMNAGVNSNIPDLPKLLIMLQIDKAIELGCNMYDVGKGDSGWKENFKLDKTSQYIIPFPRFEL
jgi:hypothetical protein